MVAHPYVIAGIVVALLTVGALIVIPLPNQYNVKVTVVSTEVPLVIATYFQINSVDAKVSGQATVLDVGALSLAGPALQATFSMTVCVGSQCTTASSSQWFPSVPIVNGAQVTATNTFTVGYVPGGQQHVTATLYQNGQSVASGDSSICVAC